MASNSGNGINTYGVTFSNVTDPKDIMDAYDSFPKEVRDFIKDLDCSLCTVTAKQTFDKMEQKYDGSHVLVFKRWASEAVHRLYLSSYPGLEAHNLTYKKNTY